MNVKYVLIVLGTLQIHRIVRKKRSEKYIHIYELVQFVNRRKPLKNSKRSGGKKIPTTVTATATTTTTIKKRRLDGLLWRGKKRVRYHCRGDVERRRIVFLSFEENKKRTSRQQFCVNIFENDKNALREILKQSL